MYGESRVVRSRVVTAICFFAFAACLPLLASSQCAAGSRPLELTGNGQLSSPNYPANYANNSDCQWRITSTSQIVYINFDFFYTEACCDVLAIYDGNAVTSPLIARLYGNVSAERRTYETTQTTMYLAFKSDSSLSFQGFTAAYQSTTPGGGGGGSTTPAPGSTTTANPGNPTSTPPATPGDPCSASTQPAELFGISGTFTSPNYPESYYNNADCQWRITATYSLGTITLDFGYLNTESCCDLIYMYDGDSTKAPLIGSVSGSPATPPGGFESTQRYMFVRFVSDSTDVGGGFTASYTSTKPEDPCSSEFQPLELTGSSGSFTSANYPSNYDNNADCQWRITAVGSNALVVLDFDSLSTESCCDIVYLHDGDSAKASLITSLSGSPQTPPSGIESTQRYMYVRFVTDDTTTGSGFSASFTSVTGQGNPCSADDRPLELTGLSGSFTSANYPNDYQNLADCQWKILSATAGSVVVLDFTDFSTESCCDLVYVYDGDTAKSPLLATLSGSPSTVPQGITSTQRYMFVRFVSDPEVTSRGFSATFTTVDGPITECGSVLRVSPEGTPVQSGWGPTCYISSDDAAYTRTACRDLIQRLPPNIGDYNALLAAGGNFGCHPLTRDDFVGADLACFPNYQQTLTLASVNGATKLIVCIRLPANHDSNGDLN